MKSALFTVVSILLLTTTTVFGESDPRVADRIGGFSLNQLETSSNAVFGQLNVDENGSITLDELDLMKAESDEPMIEEELVDRQRRANLISTYFWTTEKVNTFEVGDVNGDGSLTQAEFDNLESNVNTHVLELGIASLDTDRNGSVEANEFNAHLNDFDDWDTDGNGTLDRKEMEEITDRRFHIDIRRRWAAGERAYEEELRRRLAERERYAAEERRRRAAEGEDD